MSNQLLEAIIGTPFYDTGHRLLFHLHIAGQFELGPGPLQVVVGAVDAKVDIAVEIVGEESHGHLESEQPGAEGQPFPFQRR